MGKNPTLGVLADLTGISKNTVALLAKERRSHESLKDLKSIASSFLNLWATDPRYVGRDGQPLVLSLNGSSDSLREIYGRLDCRETFETLILEMEASGSIDTSDQSACRLLNRAHIQRELTDSALYHFERTMYTIGATLVSNMTGSGSESKLLERAAFTYGLSPLALPKFIQLSASSSASFLEIIDEWVTANVDRELATKGDFVSGVGVYAFPYESAK